jgi:hypothetical protein
MAMELQLLPFDIVDGVAQLEQFMIHGLRFVDVRAMLIRFCSVERACYLMILILCCPPWLCTGM